MSNVAAGPARTSFYGSRAGGQSARAKSDYIEREGRYEKDGEELEYGIFGSPFAALSAVLSAARA